MNKIQKSALIGLGAVLLSTVAIQASDVLRGVNGNLSGLVLEGTSVCGEGAVQLLFGSHSLCVDIYEASPSAECPHKAPQNEIETQDNANATDCHPESKEKAVPWRFISLTQAQQLCARVGKRLPTNEEWYKTVSGFNDHSSCVMHGSSVEETGKASCVTPSGVHDMIGNVWEWVDEEVVDGTYGNRTLPQSGYVSLVDTNGVVLETAGDAVAVFGNDYAWTQASGLRGVIRGGFYGSGEDAGIFAQNMSVPLDFKTSGVGFRCVRDI